MKKLPSARELRQLYTSFEGRLSQEQFWWAFLGLSVAVAIPYLGLALVLQNSIPMFRDGTYLAAVLKGALDPDIRQQLNAFLQGSLYLTIGAIVVVFLPMTAILVKRRHDRGSHGAIAILFMVLLPIPPIAFGAAVGAPEVSGIVSMALYSVPVLFALGIYLFIVCGILEGTPGPNRFGPDPNVAA